MSKQEPNTAQTNSSNKKGKGNNVSLNLFGALDLKDLDWQHFDPCWEATQVWQDTLTAGSGVTYLAAAMQLCNPALSKYALYDMLQWLCLQFKSYLNVEDPFNCKLQSNQSTLQWIHPKYPKNHLLPPLKPVNPHDSEVNPSSDESESMTLGDDSDGISWLSKPHGLAEEFHDTPDLHLLGQPGSRTSLHQHQGNLNNPLHLFLTFQPAHHYHGSFLVLLHGRNGNRGTRNINLLYYKTESLFLQFLTDSVMFSLKVLMGDSNGYKEGPSLAPPFKVFLHKLYETVILNIKVILTIKILGIYTEEATNSDCSPILWNSRDAVQKEIIARLYCLKGPRIMSTGLDEVMLKSIQFMGCRYLPG
ncbi:hypothetical protein V8B97DRAFT_1917883 [Scleroderma yunnanense]